MHCMTQACMRMQRWRLRQMLHAWAATALPDPRMEHVADVAAAQARRAAAGACLGAWRARCRRRRAHERGVARLRAGWAARRLAAGFAAWRGQADASACAARSMLAQQPHGARNNAPSSQSFRANGA